VGGGYAARKEMITCEEIAVGADPDFDAFLREWAEEHIWPVEDFLDDRDQKYLAERRSIELVQLAQEKGFSNELAEKVKSYGSVLQYVINLFGEPTSMPDRIGDFISAPSHPWVVVLLREACPCWHRPGAYL
jgi:hypothetical protein